MTKKKSYINYIPSKIVSEVFGLDLYQDYIFFKKLETVLSTDLLL